MVDFLSVLAMLLQQTINGGYTVLAESVLTSDNPISPSMFALIRDGGASIMLLIAAYITTQSKDSHPSQFWPRREHIGDFVLIGLCGVWAGQLLGAIAIKNIGGVVFSVMQPAQPVLTLIIAVAIGMERLVLCGPSKSSRYSWLKLIGMVVTVTGAVIVLVLGSHKSNKTDKVFYGTVILIIQVVAGALYGIFQKRVLGQYPALVVTAWGYTFGLLEIVMTVLPQVGDPGFFHVPTEALVTLAYSIFLNSALGYFLMAWVNQRTSPFFVTIFYPVQFVMSALFHFVFVTPHRLATIVVIGGAVISCGLYMVVTAQAQERELHDDDSRYHRQPTLGTGSGLGDDDAAYDETLQKQLRAYADYSEEDSARLNASPHNMHTNFLDNADLDDDDDELSPARPPSQSYDLGKGAREPLIDGAV